MSQTSQKGQIITGVVSMDPYALVIETHKRLNQEVENMNAKIEEKIQKSEGEFLVAYQNHLRKIRIELAELRVKFEQHEKQNTKNDRVFLLEKQNILFRDEALKLYNRLQQKTQQAEIYRAKSKQLQNSLELAHRQLKELLRDKKLLENKLQILQTKVNGLQKQQMVKNQKKIISSRSGQYTSEIKIKNISLKNNKLGIKLKELHQEGRMAEVKTTRHEVKHQRKSAMNYTGSFISGNSDEQLKNWFLECIRTIKKDVALRKTSNDQVNLDYIVNIEKFKMVDKLRLLQKFMENQKLLTWMYEKIFPSRMNQLTEYFSKGKTQPIVKNSHNNSEILQKSQNNKLSDDIYQYQETQGIQQNYTESIERFNNKFMQLKNKRNIIRNKVIIKNGKLNLTSL